LRIWVTAAMWVAWFSRRLPRCESRCTTRCPEETSIGAVPVQDAKPSLVANRVMSPGVADDDGGDDGAGAVDAGKAGAARFDGVGEVGAGVAELQVQVAQVGDVHGGGLVPGPWPLPWPGGRL
jgi:hypothetical protein